MPQLRAAAQPSTLGHYTLVERIGVGGQGEVWKAHDDSRGVDVALKVLAASAARNPAAWEMLEREHALSSRLQHPGILQVLPPERVDAVVVLPMELAGGGDLRRLRGAGYLEIVPVLLEVAEALEYAHARGVVHRDLKPGNVLFDSRGRVKLADFGIAALLPAAGGSADSRPSGHSPFSASPAQLRGEPPSAADDIYGLGALAYELLSGQPPYYPNFDLKRALTQPVPELVPTRQIPPELGELVMRMLAKSAAERPASMQQVMDDLDATLNATLSFAPDGVETSQTDGPAPEVIQAAGQKNSVPRPSQGQVQAQAPEMRAPEKPAPEARVPESRVSPARVSEAPVPEQRAPEQRAEERRISESRAADARVAALRVSEPDTPIESARPLRSEARAPTRAHADGRPTEERAGRRNPPPASPISFSPDARRQRGEASWASAPHRARAAEVGTVTGLAVASAARPRDDGSRPLTWPERTAAQQAHRPQQPTQTHSLSPLPSEPVSQDDPLGLDIVEPRLRATPPMGRRSSPQRAGVRRARRWPYLVSGLLCGAALICAATAAALFWLPRQDIAGLQSLLANLAPIASSQATKPAAAAPENTPVSAAPAPTPAPKPQVDPAALARFNSERADFQKQAAALSARGAAAWAGSDFSAAQLQAAEASGAAAAGGIPIALQHLSQAEQLLANVSRKAPQALAWELKTGDAALAAGHQDLANQAYALARRIDPKSQHAIDGARRARLLKGVLPLLIDAKKAESAHNYSRAAQDFSQALALDPGNDLAKTGLARVNSAFGDDNYARAVGAGFAALGAGRLTEARTDFQQALGLRPQGTEATEGMQRVTAAMDAGQMAALRQHAASLEAQEHWRQAVGGLPNRPAGKPVARLCEASQGPGRGTGAARRLAAADHRPSGPAGDAVRARRGRQPAAGSSRAEPFGPGAAVTDRESRSAASPVGTAGVAQRDFRQRHAGDHSEHWSDRQFRPARDPAEARDVCRDRQAGRLSPGAPGVHGRAGPAERHDHSELLGTFLMALDPGPARPSAALGKRVVFPKLRHFGGGHFLCLTSQFGAPRA